MGNIGSVATILEVVFGLIALVAAAVAVARASFAKAQIEALRGDRDDLQKRSEIQETEIQSLRTELETEKAKVKVLQDITIGKEHLITIEELIKKLDKSTGEYLSEIEQLIRDRVGA